MVFLKPHTQFGKGFTRCLGHKDRVVTKSFSTSFLRSNLALHNAFKEVLLSVYKKRDNGTKLCRTVGFIFQFMQQFLGVRHGVVSIGISVTRCMHPGTSVKRGHLQAGIVCKAIVTINVP